MDIPQQPYFLRALYEWCVDSGLTPHISVSVNNRCKVPMAYVKDGQIVLNIGPNAVRDIQIDNEWVSFSARFSGVSQDVHVPMDAIQAIYARENGAGMAFQPMTASDETAPESDITPLSEDPDSDTPPPPPRPSGRPSLKVVK